MLTGCHEESLRLRLVLMIWTFVLAMNVGPHGCAVIMDEFEPPAPSVPPDAVSVDKASGSMIVALGDASHDPSEETEADRASFSDVAPPPAADDPSQTGLTKFEMREIDARDCAELRTDNCRLESTSKDCDPRNGFHGICSAEATETDVFHFMEKLARVNASRGLKLRLVGPRNFTEKMLSPARDFLVGIIIEDFDGLVLSDLAAIANSTPWLVHLSIINCQNVVLHKDDLKAFKQLVVFIFSCSKFQFVEENAFDLDNLRMLALDNEFNCKKSRDRTAHRYQLHCDCSYQWLRVFLKKRSFLLKKRKIGDVHNIGGIAHRAYSQRDLFKPVDCATKGLVGKSTQTEFSINDVCA